MICCEEHAAKVLKDLVFHRISFAFLAGNLHLRECIHKAFHLFSVALVGDLDGYRAVLAPPDLQSCRRHLSQLSGWQGRVFFQILQFVGLLVERTLHHDVVLSEGSCVRRVSLNTSALLCTKVRRVSWCPDLRTVLIKLFRYVGLFPLRFVCVNIFSSTGQYSRSETLSAWWLRCDGCSSGVALRSGVVMKDPNVRVFRSCCASRKNCG